MSVLCTIQQINVKYMGQKEEIRRVTSDKDP